jgi:hypothetical protein
MSAIGTRRPENPEDQLDFRRWRLGFFAFYSAVALLLGGLDIARLRRYEAGPRSRFDQLKAIDDSEEAADIYGHDDPVYDAQLKAMNAAKRANIESELTDLGIAGPSVPGRGLYAGQYSIDAIRKATGIGSAGGEPVKAEGCR